MCSYLIHLYCLGILNHLITQILTMSESSRKGLDYKGYQFNVLTEQLKRRETQDAGNGHIMKPL